MRIQGCVRTIFNSAFLLAVAVGGPSPTICAQEAEREALVEPTYRVSTNDSSRKLSSLDEASASATLAELAAEAEMPAAESPPTNSTNPAPDASGSETTLSAPEQIFGEALADAANMLLHIQSDVEDYTCMFVKRECVKGHVVGPQYGITKVRSRRVENGQVVVPFSVYIKFVKPNNIKGREVLYIEGMNNGKILAKEGGTAGRFMPAVWLPADGRFAMRDNLYPITEFGIENLTSRLLERGHADRSISKCVVTYREGAKVCDRACKMMEVRRETPKVGEDAKYGMNVFIARVFTDMELNVPIRYSAYAWPECAGATPEVVEEYTYQDMKLNVGLTDLDFDPKNPEYAF